MVLCGHVILWPPCILHNVEEEARAFGSVKEAWGLTRRITAVEAGDTEDED